MTRAVFAASLAVVISVGCASKTPAVAVESPEERAAADRVRAQKLADALSTGVVVTKPVPETMHLGFSVDAVRAGESGAAIVGFVILPNGRVERETRTLIYVEGHPIYAKYICDALLVARFEPPPTDPRGRVGSFPVFFYIKDGPARDSARVAFEAASKAFSRRLHSMTPDEALAWFQARPSCSAIKIGIER